MNNDFDLFSSGPLLPVEEDNFPPTQDSTQADQADHPSPTTLQDQFDFGHQNQPSTSTSTAPIQPHPSNQNQNQIGYENHQQQFANQHQQQQQPLQQHFQAPYGFNEHHQRPPMSPMEHQNYQDQRCFPPQDPRQQQHYQMGFQQPPQMPMQPAGYPIRHAPSQPKRARVAPQNGPAMGHYNQFNPPMSQHSMHTIPQQPPQEYWNVHHQDPKRAAQQQQRMHQSMEQQRRQMWQAQNPMREPDHLDQPGPSNARFDPTKIKTEPFDEGESQCSLCRKTTMKLVHNELALQRMNEMLQTCENTLNFERTGFERLLKDKDSELAQMTEALKLRDQRIAELTNHTSAPNSIPNTASTTSSVRQSASTNSTPLVEYEQIHDEEPMVIRDMSPYVQRGELPPNGFANAVEAEAFMAGRFVEKAWSNWAGVKKFFFNPRKANGDNEGVELPQMVQAVSKPHYIYMSNKQGGAKKWTELEPEEKAWWEGIHRQLEERQKEELHLGLVMLLTKVKVEEPTRAPKRGRVREAQLQSPPAPPHYWPFPPQHVHPNFNPQLFAHPHPPHFVPNQHHNYQ